MAYHTMRRLPVAPIKETAKMIHFTSKKNLNSIACRAYFSLYALVYLLYSTLLNSTLLTLLHSSYSTQLYSTQLYSTLLTLLDSTQPNSTQLKLNLNLKGREGEPEPVRQAGQAGQAGREGVIKGVMKGGTHIFHLFTCSPD